MITSKIFERTNQPCAVCGTIEDLTRHHLKNLAGRKTGIISILCRRCHDNAERYYEKLGITASNKIQITPNEKLQLAYMGGKIPFYSTRQSQPIVRYGT